GGSQTPPRLSIDAQCPCALPVCAELDNSQSNSSAGWRLTSGEPDGPHLRLTVLSSCLVLPPFRPRKCGRPASAPRLRWAFPAPMTPPGTKPARRDRDAFQPGRVLGKGVPPAPRIRSRP